MFGIPRGENAFLKIYKKRLRYYTLSITDIENEFAEDDQELTIEHLQSVLERTNYQKLTIKSHIYNRNILKKNILNIGLNEKKQVVLNNPYRYDINITNRILELFETRNVIATPKLIFNLLNDELSNINIYSENIIDNDKIGYRVLCLMNTNKFKKIEYTDNDIIEYFKIITPYLLDNTVMLDIGQMMMNNFTCTEKFIIFTIKCGYAILHNKTSLNLILKMNMDEIFKYACIHHVIEIITFCLENKFLLKTEHIYYVLLGRELSYTLTYDSIKKNIKNILILFINYGFHITDNIYELLIIHEIDISDISMLMISKESKNITDKAFISIQNIEKIYNKDIFDNNTITYNKVQKSKYKCKLCYLCAGSHLCNIISHLENTKNKLDEDCMHNSVNNMDYNVFEYIHDTYDYIPSLFTIMTIFDYAKRYTFLQRFYPDILKNYIGSIGNKHIVEKVEKKRGRQSKNI